MSVGSGSATQQGATLWLFLLVALFWGVNYPAVVLGLGYAPPLWLGFLRVVFGLGGSLLVLPLLERRMGRSERLTWRGKGYALLLGLPNSALFFGLWMIAAPVVPAGQASLLVYTFPLWVLLLAYPILGDRPTLGQIGASAVGLAGVALVGFADVSSWTAGWTPVLELLGAAISWAVATVLMKRTFRQQEMLEANIWQLLGSAPVLLALALFEAPFTSVHWTTELLLVLLWTGILGTAVAYGLWFELLSAHRAATVSAYLFIVPVVALVAGFLVLHQGLGVPQAIGVLAVLLSIYGTHRFAPDPAHPSSRLGGVGPAPRAGS